MSSPTTETIQVVLTVTRSPTQKVYQGDKTLNIPADELDIFIEAAKMYFSLLADDTIQHH